MPPKEAQQDEATVLVNLMEYIKNEIENGRMTAEQGFRLLGRQGSAGPTTETTLVEQLKRQELRQRNPAVAEIKENRARVDRMLYADSEADLILGEIMTRFKSASLNEWDRFILGFLPPFCADKEEAYKRAKLLTVFIVRIPRQHWVKYFNALQGRSLLETYAELLTKCNKPIFPIGECDQELIGLTTDLITRPPQPEGGEGPSEAQTAMLPPAWMPPQAQPTRPQSAGLRTAAQILGGEYVVPIQQTAKGPIADLSQVEAAFIAMNQKMLSLEAMVRDLATQRQPQERQYSSPPPYNSRPPSANRGRKGKYGKGVRGGNEQPPNTSQQTGSNSNGNSDFRPRP
jgi:hypothetical protein